MQPVLLFAFTLFLSASLMFIVELMVGKLVLPYLGGTPAVWNTCMVFWQALLLGGYFYAHLLTRRTTLAKQIKIHAFVLLVPLLPLLIFRLNIGGVVDWIPPPGEANPIPWLLTVLLMTIGLPFFAISTTASLLQRWYSETDFPGAKDPYFLYGASNVGSMLALFSYPLLIEPMGRYEGFGLTTQALLWIAGYAMLAGLILYCGARARHAVDNAPAPELPPPPPEEEQGPTHEGVEMVEPEPAVVESANGVAEPPSTLRKLRWVALAFVPSSLMLGVTTHITTDIAAIPLIWMLPLAIYLLSFILVFSRLPIAVHRSMVALLMPVTLLVVCAPFGGGFQLPTWYLVAAAAVLMGILLGRLPGTIQRLRDGEAPANADIFFFILLVPLLGLMVAMSRVEGHSILSQAEITLFEHTWQVILLHLIGLFVVAMVCHGEMARTRPPSQHLTEFFLLMSLGGVLGGMFNALVAPNMFNQIVEYPLMAVAACLLVPGFGFDTSKRWLERLDLAWTVVIVVFGASVSLIVLARYYQTAAMLATPVVRLGEYLPEPFNKAAEGVIYNFAGKKASILEERNFFGYFCINEYAYGGTGEYFFGLIPLKREEKFHYMTHGTTTHGMQNMSDGKRDQALAYFHRRGPIGQLFEAMYARNKPLNVAVLGVGTGTLAAYMKPGWNLTLYEIDPAVVKVARDPAYFTFIEDCAARGVGVDVILGDGRLKIKEAPDHSFDMLFMDAFTSDAVPVHLLTREAFELYKQKLKPDGVLVVNIANRYLDFDPVLANLATATDLVARVSYGASDRKIDRYATHWVVLAKSLKDFGPLLGSRDDDGNPAWVEIKPDDAAGEERKRRVGVWTDSYSNLWSVFRW